MKRGILAFFAVAFAWEITALILFGMESADNPPDAVEVNEVVQTIQNDWDNFENHGNKTALNYVVIDNGGKVVFRTARGLSESVNSAVIHRDTILDIEKDGKIAGKVIIYNDTDLSNRKNKLITVFVISVITQFAVCVIYAAYLNVHVIKPFGKLKGFAERVARGNLDIPLEMDRGNLFGAFTESFDIMREELKKSRLAEAKANASKKELVAKLSHDIKTPTASIKAVAELGAAISENDRTRENFTRIISKANQINALVVNLFSATLEELRQLTVTPDDISSAEIRGMLESADYFHKAKIPEIPECMIYADKLRLQQVFDNIFANSYKYANTDIIVKSSLNDGNLAVEIEDFGGGVNDEELPLLKEKFKRGRNTENIDGAGLGLYISDCFMNQMNGELLVENGEYGLKITVIILLS